MTFKSFLAYFCGPTSTTPVLDIATRFCGANGLILELTKENNYSLLKHLEVSWLSNYAEEEERLFISGSKPLQFSSITYLRPGHKPENYHLFIFSLTLFDYVLNGKQLNGEHFWCKCKTCRKGMKNKKNYGRILRN